MRHYISLGICLLFFMACQQQEKKGSAIPETLPNTPETVVRQYQALMDSNRFERAALLSTPDGQAMLNMLAEIMAGDPPDSSIIHTNFLDLNCAVQKDTARCNCLLRDEYEEYASQFKLLKINGQWLVDIPEEDEVEMSEEEWLDEGREETGEQE
jgi:hypothetical protein